MTATDSYNRFKTIVKEGWIQPDRRLILLAEVDNRTDEKSPRPTVNSDRRHITSGQSAECFVFVCIEGDHTFRRYDYLHASSYFE